MTEKRFTLRLHPKDKGVKILNNHVIDNWRVLNLHFNDYEDAKFVRDKLEPVVDLLNEQHKEKEELIDALNQRTEQCDKLHEENQTLRKALQEYEESTNELFEENKKLRRINNDLLDKIE